MITPSESLRKSFSQNRYLRNLKNIQFPVYKADGEPIEINKVLFVNGFPIDDLTVKKPTLALRRLHSKINLKGINRACLDVADIIRSLKGQENWFIDSYGKCFKYVKTARHKVASHKIVKIDLRDTYCIVSLQGIDVPFIEPRPPELQFARVLYYHAAPWLILEYNSERIPTSTKKV